MTRFGTSFYTRLVNRLPLGKFTINNKQQRGICRKVINSLTPETVQGKLRTGCLAVQRASLLCRHVQSGLKASEEVGKADASPVTVADFGAQAIVAWSLQKEFTNISLIAEETSSAIKGSEFESMRRRITQLVNSFIPKEEPVLSEMDVMDLIDLGSSEGGSSGLHWVLDPIDGTRGFVSNRQYAICLGLLYDGEAMLGILGCPNLPQRRIEELDGVSNGVSGDGGGCLFTGINGGDACVGSLWDDELPSQVISVKTGTPMSEVRFMESFEKRHSNHQMTETLVALQLGIKRTPLRLDSQAKYGALSRGDAELFMRFPPKNYKENIWDHCAGSVIVEAAGGKVSDGFGNRLDFSKGRKLDINCGIIAAPSELHSQVTALITSEYNPLRIHFICDQEEFHMHCFENGVSLKSKKSNWELIEKTLHRQGISIPHNLVQGTIDKEYRSAVTLLETLHKQLTNSGILGLACFDEDFEELKVFQAWDDNVGPSPHQILRLALMHLTPTIVYVNSGVSLELLSVLETSSVPGLPSPVVKFEKNSVFQIDYAVDQLQYLEISAMPETVRDADKIHWINSRINFSATQQLRALGALLYILQKEKSKVAQNGLDSDEEDDEGVLKVQDLSQLNLDGYLMIDGNTLTGLQIFQEDTHPSVLGIGQSKEGFSVFGMMNRCVTSAGRRMLQSWFLRPMLNLDMISDRLTAIQLLVHKPDVLKLIREALKKIKDIPSILKGLQSYYTTQKVQLFAQLRSSIEAILHVSRITEELSRGSFYQHSEDDSRWPLAWQELMIVQKFAANITEQLGQCAQLISDVINFDTEDGDLFVLSGICPALDKLKVTYNQLPEILTQIVEKELRRIPRFLVGKGSQDLWSIVYVPQVGYLVQVLGQPLGADILDILEDYKQVLKTAFIRLQTRLIKAFESTTEDGSLVCYYRSQCTENLNQQYGDLLHKIQDMENSLCAELICQLLEYKARLIKATCITAELDCLCSLAQVAYEGNYCCPVVTEDNELIIHQGPNASGKSSYLKQVALIVFLSHIGAFVPAKECRIGITDRIFSRICTSLESKTLTIKQSAFMLDLVQIVTMIKQATSRSLLIIDEFGKGTLTSDGVGLLTAMLEYWSNHDSCPRIIACTHFTELVSNGLLQKSLQIQFLTMQVIFDQQNRHIVLFKLVPGTAESSYGIDCAKVCGMPEEVISRAKEIVSVKESGQRLNGLDLDTITKKSASIRDCMELLAELDRPHVATRDQLKRIEQILLTLLDEARTLLARMGSKKQIRSQRESLEDGPPRQPTQSRERKVVRPKFSCRLRIVSSSPLPPHSIPSPPYPTSSSALFHASFPLSPQDSTSSPLPVSSPPSPTPPSHPAPPSSMWFPVSEPPCLDYMDLEYTSESIDLDEMDWTPEPLDPDDMWWEPTPPSQLLPNKGKLPLWSIDRMGRRGGGDIFRIDRF
eukprot:g1104.t1